MYYVEFYDFEQKFKTLKDACRECIRQMIYHDFYSRIDIYPNRDTKRPSGFVQTNGKDFFYVSFTSKGRRFVRKLRADGSMVDPRLNRLRVKQWI